MNDRFADEAFFLSRVNPTATADQRELEALALEIVKSPTIVDAQAQATTRFKIMGGSDIPAEALDGIDEKMAEWAFHYVILALNSDSNYPKVLGHGYGPPHEWFGMKVPGCRGLGTGENPDNHYSFVPVDGHSRFALYGKVSDQPVGDCPMFITSNLSQSMNVAWLDWRDVVIADDGTFVITIDPEPASGRPNHLQTTLDAKYLFIRDGRRDWGQVPNAYRIERLDAPTAPPRTVEQLTAVAKRFIIDDVPTNYWFKQMVAFLEPNTITAPANSSGVGGMQTQQLLRGRLSLADDEAYVLTLDPGGSDYWVLTLYDWWLMSGNFWSRTSCLNTTQSVANPDGTYTYVFSIQDPGGAQLGGHPGTARDAVHAALATVAARRYGRRRPAVGGRKSFCAWRTGQARRSQGHVADGHDVAVAAGTRTPTRRAVRGFPAASHHLTSQPVSGGVRR
ncbi:hypothetical protein IWGMT90018_46600 [Mycobacterium kiyosense]|nr:hypothetical protein IWGMT90018_46600 [Mycobacterium kiyosense]